MAESVVLDKSKSLAIRFIKLYKYLMVERKEFVLSKQLLKSGTSIGANCREAYRGQSSADFTAKLGIALKEAEESAYWLELLFESDFITKEQFNSIYKDNEEVIKLLVSIIKSTKLHNS